jgi:DNA-binding protein
LIDNS